MANWDGPTLRGVVRRMAGRMAGQGGIGVALAPYVLYRYEGDDGRRSPAWAATRIRVEAFYAATGTPLEPLTEAIGRMSGCLGAEIVAGTLDVRPHVRAWFAYGPEAGES
jgi:hypothetical protein